MTIVLIHLIGFKKGTFNVVRKGSKYMDFINVLYERYKKFIKKLMCFSPLTKCFYEDVLANIPHTILSEPSL